MNPSHRERIQKKQMRGFQESSAKKKKVNCKTCLQRSIAYIMYNWQFRGAGI